MRITELLSEDGIDLGVKVGSKEAAIDHLVDLHDKCGNITDKAEYKAGILKREEEGSTAIGEGIAIPHAKNKAVKRPALAAMTVPDGVDYDALDGQPSNLFFMIAAPENGGDVHLEVLSRLSMLLMDEDFRKKLLAARDKKEFLKVIDEAEVARFGDEIKKDEDNTSSDSSSEENTSAAREGYRVLAVTACPTGIAHTYMAAEALEKAGETMGISIKVETNGSGGAKNILTDQEIAAADGIIVAADKNVETARFDGKKVLFTKVADGIHKPEELINRIESGDAPVFHAEGESKKSSSSSGGGAGVGHSIYTSLMGGVSHMLPFVIGGGIMIALAFLVDDYTIDPSNFGMNTPVAAFFKTVGNAAFNFMLPILAAYIAYSIAERPGLAVGFAGGVLAMNGTSFMNLMDPSSAVSAGFLGAMLAGFAAGYLVKGLEKLTSRFPKSIDGLRPMLIYPFGGILIIGLFMCAVNPIMSWLNMVVSNWLNSMGDTSRILLGIIVAGMMSVDMGGPINKAAYVFGTASLASGNYDIMAAVMVGGMVPPVAIALSATFAKNKWSKTDRRDAMVNYIMGLCFITEGAIPYAAKDPLRVIPSCIVGSAVAGALSMAFRCTLRAPHGGIFVFPVVGHWPMYLLALVAGSLVGALILSLLKKRVEAE